MPNLEYLLAIAAIGSCMILSQTSSASPLVAGLNEADPTASEMTSGLVEKVGDKRYDGHKRYYGRKYYRHRYPHRRPWPNLPIAPSYRAYDWPYYYNRGYYPTHIGPGYVYYGYPYYYRSSHYPRCSYWPAKTLRRAWIDARRCLYN